MALGLCALNVVSSSRTAPPPVPILLAVAAQLKFESSLPYFSFKSLIPGAFNVGFDRVNLHRPTSLSYSLLPF